MHQLSELAASVSLAGTEGARVRASLAAKARRCAPVNSPTLKAKRKQPPNA
ncbi:hypothetical protein ACFSVJ_21760 [Prauserella oleivorans]